MKFLEVKIFPFNWKTVVRCWPSNARRVCSQSRTELLLSNTKSCKQNCLILLIRLLNKTVSFFTCDRQALIFSTYHPRAESGSCRLNMDGARREGLHHAPSERIFYFEKHDRFNRNPFSCENPRGLEISTNQINCLVWNIRPLQYELRKRENYPKYNLPVNEHVKEVIARTCNK